MYVRGQEGGRGKGGIQVSSQGHGVAKALFSQRWEEEWVWSGGRGQELV